MDTAKLFFALTWLLALVMPGIAGASSSADHSLKVRRVPPPIATKERPLFEVGAKTKVKVSLATWEDIDSGKWVGLCEFNDGRRFGAMINTFTKGEIRPFNNPQAPFRGKTLDLLRNEKLAYFSSKTDWVLNDLREESRRTLAQSGAIYSPTFDSEDLQNGHVKTDDGMKDHMIAFSPDKKTLYYQMENFHPEARCVLKCTLRRR